MTTEIARIQPLPSPTPQHSQSLSPAELENHRSRIGFEVEVILQGYWQTQLDARMKAAVLVDWADELQDWPLEQVRWGLREWRKANPSKRPNPGHIVSVLKEKRGKAHVDRKPSEPSQPNPDPVTREAAEQIMQEAGFTVRRFGG